jgi:hypothetical protein
MAPRVTSDFFVAAYVRRRNDAGRFTAVVRRGAAEAGAIFVKVARLDRTADLYGPAPQMLVDDADVAVAGGRVFERLMAARPEDEVDERLAREHRFDTDLWVVETEARDGDHGLDVVAG